MNVIKAGYKIVSPCDAFYFYLKPLSPTVALQYNFRDLRALFQATGQRLGAAKVTVSDTILRALWVMVTAAPRSAIAVINQEWTRIRLRMTFPDKRAGTDQMTERRP